jgi:hypothetical protein
MSESTFLTRIRLQNYRSIAACDFRLGPLRFLVGPNGSGKSNVVDALRLVADSLNTTLDHALRDRGGIQEGTRPILASVWTSGFATDEPGCSHSGLERDREAATRFNARSFGSRASWAPMISTSWIRGG